FISYAFEQDAGRFRNFMAYSRQWLESRGSEDSHGRALWALGTVVGRVRDGGRSSLARELFQAALPATLDLSSPRAWAFCLLGIHEYLRGRPADEAVASAQRLLSERLLSQFQNASTSDWLWCEDIITYENARLPQALIVSGHALRRTEMLTVGLRALEWLTQIQRSENDLFSPVGSNGFYPRGADKALFDQQPVEACAMVSACFDAWRVTGEANWVAEMRLAFSWFLGENELQVSLYDPTTGGCRDGLHVDRANENQGAESTLSFLLALTDMALLESEMRLHEQSVQTMPNVRVPA